MLTRSFLYRIAMMPSPEDQRSKAKHSPVNRLVKRCLETNKPVDEPNVITCRCKNCWSYLCELEDSATCEHGFLVGCPKCV